MSTDYALPEPAFRLTWKNAAYYVSRPNVGDTDCYTADQLRACAEHARAEITPRVVEILKERDAALARVVELEKFSGSEDEHDAPLPPEYKVGEFLPGIWAWSVKGESEWVGDGAAYGCYEAAVVAAWRDHADTLTSALDESTAAETLAIAERDRLRAEVEALRAKINTPHTKNFAEAAVLEAVHQRDRWGSAHDAGKAPEDWFWLLGYLSGKALHAAKSGDTEKAMHHTISSAAALANWHAALSGASTDMRPGIDPVARGIEDDSIAAQAKEARSD